MLSLWLRYWFHLPLPAIGFPQFADVVVAQAFGRNTYDQADLRNIRVFHDMKGANDKVTLEWLGQQRFNPGLPNKHLAIECQELVDWYSISAIVQWEVAAALDPLWYSEHHDQIICLWPPAKAAEYFSTRDVNIAAVEVMRRNGWTKPIELAHRRQAVRAYLILRKLLGSDPVAVPIRTDDFDEKSVQKWTRSWYAWEHMNSLGGSTTRSCSGFELRTSAESG